MKTILTALLIMISLSVNAKWVELDIGMYYVMEQDGAEIISETTGGSHNNRLITTMRVGFDYYRCIYKTRSMEKYDCWMLVGPDK
jgi:hypothetical protein